MVASHHPAGFQEIVSPVLGLSSTCNALSVALLPFSTRTAIPYCVPERLQDGDLVLYTCI